ncbi:oligosaccharide flippase family protein, partial [bacterium]|nr:oligosaccharide flippase family protein [bacterium]
MLSSQRRLFFLNTAANVAGRFWVKLLALVIIPLLFRYLGEMRWALYSLGLTVMFLFSLFDPGLRFGTIKVFSEFFAADRSGDLKRLLWTVFWLYIAAGTAVVALSWLGMGVVLRLAAVEPDLRGPAAFLFLCFLTHSSISQAGSVFNHVLLAAQRMSLSNGLTMAGTLVHYSALGLVIWEDWGITGLGLVFVLSALFQGLLFQVAAVSLLRDFPEGQAPESRGRLLRYLFGFGWRMKVAIGADTVILHVDKIFVAQFVGFGTAGLYQLGSSVAIVLRDFVRLLVSALLPVTSRMGASAGIEKMREVNRLTSRWFLILSSPCFLFVAAMAPCVIAIWGGERIDEAAWALGFLCLAFYLNTAMAASMEVGAGAHLPGLQMRSGLAAAVGNLLLNVALVIPFGLRGVLAASALSMGMGSLY